MNRYARCLVALLCARVLLLLKTEAGSGGAREFIEAVRAEQLK
jgi:hypothetical protein